MELEVYNEYAIVQHYSDLTDYISENIYILDKKNQSEIITENWGLIALGGLIVIGLGILIWWLCTRKKDNPKKEKKIEKKTEDTEKIVDAAINEIQKTDNFDDLKQVRGWLLLSLLKYKNIFASKAGSKPSEDKNQNETKYHWELDYSSVNIFALGDVKPADKNKPTLKEYQTVEKNILDYIKKYSGTAKGLAKKILSLLKSEDFSKYINDVKNGKKDPIIQIDRKSSKILAYYAKNFNIELSENLKEAEKAFDKAEKAGSHSSEWIDNIATKVGLSGDQLKAFQALINITPVDKNLNLQKNNTTIFLEMNEAEKKAIDYLKTHMKKDPTEIDLPLGDISESQFKNYKETCRAFNTVLANHDISTLISNIYQLVDGVTKYSLSISSGNANTEEFDSNFDKAKKIILAKVTAVGLCFAINAVRAFYLGRKTKLDEIKFNNTSIKSAASYTSLQEVRKNLTENYGKDDQIDKTLINSLIKELFGELLTLQNTFSYMSTYCDHIALLAATTFAASTASKKKDQELAKERLKDVEKTDDNSW